MNSLKAKLLKMRGFKAWTKTTKITVYSNADDNISAQDSICKFYDSKGHKFFEVNNGKFEARVDDRYIVVLGNSNKDEFYSKEFFIIDEDEAKVVFRSEMGDSFKYCASSGNNHYYVCYNKKTSKAITVENFLRDTETPKIDAYANSSKVGSAVFLYKENGTVDVISKCVNGERGITNFPAVTIIKNDLLGTRSCAILTGSSGLMYLITEDGVCHNDMPYKSIDGAGFKEGFSIAGVKENGDIVKLDSMTAKESNCQVRIASDYISGRRFRKVNWHYQLVDADDNVIRGSIANVRFGFHEVIKNNESKLVASIIYNNQDAYLDLEGNIYNTYKQKWR